MDRTPSTFLGDAGLEDVERTVEIGLGNDQRRGQGEHVAHGDLEAEAGFQRPVEDGLGAPAPWIPSRNPERR